MIGPQLITWYQLWGFKLLYFPGWSLFGVILTSWWNEYIFNQCMSPSWGMYVTNYTHYTIIEGNFFSSWNFFFHIFCFPKNAFWRKFCFNIFFFIPSLPWNSKKKNHNFFLFKNSFFSSFFFLSWIISKILFSPQFFFALLFLKCRLFLNPPPTPHKKKQKTIKQRLSNKQLSTGRGYRYITFFGPEGSYIFPQRCELLENITTCEI